MTGLNFKAQAYLKFISTSKEALNDDYVTLLVTYKCLLVLKTMSKKKKQQQQAKF